MKSMQEAREAAENKLSSQSDGGIQLQERLGMAAEELMTRQVLFALEKQRLSGALEESRRTLRNSLAVPTSTTAMDTVRITGLESSSRKSDESLSSRLWLCSAPKESAHSWKTRTK